MGQGALHHRGGHLGGFRGMLGPFPSLRPFSSSCLLPLLPLLVSFASLPFPPPPPPLPLLLRLASLASPPLLVLSCRPLSRSPSSPGDAPPFGCGAPFKTGPS